LTDLFGRTIHWLIAGPDKQLSFPWPFRVFSGALSKNEGAA